MRLGYIILTIIVVMSLIIGMMHLTQVGWEMDGAPEATITVVIRETDTGDAWSADVATDKTVVQTIMGSGVSMRPLTTYQPDIIGVEPNKKYELEFVVNFQGDLPDDAPEGVNMTADVVMSGQRETTPPEYQWFMTPNLPDPHIEINDIALDSNYIGTAEFTKANGIYWDSLVMQDGSNPQQIAGMYIDGSEWTCVMTTSSGYAGTDAYWGTTTITIILNVDTTGNVNIVMTDVDMFAGEV